MFPTIMYVLHWKTQNAKYQKPKYQHWKIGLRARYHHFEKSCEFPDLMFSFWYFLGKKFNTCDLQKSLLTSARQAKPKRFNLSKSQKCTFKTTWKGSCLICWVENKERQNSYRCKGVSSVSFDRFYLRFLVRWRHAAWGSKGCEKPFPICLLSYKASHYGPGSPKM